MEKNKQTEEDTAKIDRFLDCSFCEERNRKIDLCKKCENKSKIEVPLAY